MKTEYEKLKDKGFNPFKDQQYTVEQPPLVGNTGAQDQAALIEPDTPFIVALQRAAKELGVSHQTRRDMKSALKGIEKAASQLKLSSEPISKISWKQLKLVLEQCGRNSEKWSNHRSNTYRGYLMMVCLPYHIK